MSTKADKLADSDAGSDRLGRLMEAIEGPDWRPKGNGLLKTHYIPPFTERNGRKQLTVCGEWVDPRCDHSTEPTCPTCQAYLLAEPQTQAEAEADADRLFGIS